jgi:hypothetical protein
MSVSSFSKTRRISIPVGDESVTIIVREPSSKERSDFLTSRFEMQGRKVKNQMTEARARFIRPLLLDVENATYEDAHGVPHPLNKSTTLSEEDKSYVEGVLGIPVKDWRDLVNISWLSSAAMAFEDAAPEGN